MPMPDPDTVASAIVASLEGIGAGGASADEAKKQAWVAVVTQIQAMVRAGTVTGLAAGVMPGGASVPVTGTLT
jgi:hypothetical protein